MEQGGAERVISLLSNSFADEGHDVEIVLLLKNIVNKQFSLNERIGIVDMSPYRNGYLRNSFFWIKKIRKYLVGRKPDRVISFVGRINCLVLTASFGLRIPIFVSERNDPRNDGRGFWFLKYCNFIYRRSNKVIFQTKYEMSCFSKSVIKKGVVLPNPVSVNAQWNPKRDGQSFLIVNTARLTKQKNLILLFKSVILLREQGFPVNCVVYGDGDMRDELESFIIDNKADSFILLPGNMPDVTSLISSADVFVQTSSFEGLSNSLIEAMMVGLPCICTEYPGIDELIKDGYNGILTSLTDEKQLCEHIIQLFSDQVLAMTISDNAKKTATKYTPNNVIKKWKDEIQI